MCIACVSKIYKLIVCLLNYNNIINQFISVTELNTLMLSGKPLKKDNLHIKDKTSSPNLSAIERFHCSHKFKRIPK